MNWRFFILAIGSFSYMYELVLKKIENFTVIIGRVS